MKYLRLLRATGAALVLLALAGTQADAHRLNLFAATDGERITGSAYFTGGGKAGGVAVQLQTLDGKTIASTKTADDGSFSLPKGGPDARVIVVDTGDGHVARFTLSAAELGFASETAQQPSEPPPASPSGPAMSLDRQAIETAVERAVARQIVPLREQIADYEAKVRLHDILGGLGYLAGLAGLAFWLLARRERARRGK